MYDLMTGLSEQGVRCDMLCAVEGKSETIRLNDHANLICCHAVKKVAATMISPSMVWTLRKICREYDILHIHHPDPMACLALFLSGYKGRVILHWHSDILKQKNLLKENFIEGMACTGGCIGGAGCLTHGEKNKNDVDKYGREAMEKTISDVVSILQ